MVLFDVVLVVATVLCSLVAGFLFAFAVVVMPGIGRLPDREFVRAFQEVDGVIQRGQPLFGLVWLGSALALAVGIGLAWQVGGTTRLALLIVGAAYFLGVQLPTIAVNIPLNNGLQALDIEGADDDTVREARHRFEARWNRWNVMRTVFAVLGAAGLSLVLLQLR